MPFKWMCPFCDKGGIITESNRHSDYVLFADMIEEDKIVGCIFIECPNPDCKKFTFSISLYKDKYPKYKPPGLEDRVIDIEEDGDLIKKWDLIPISEAKSFPDYIPEPILEDYEEACLIKDLSPKASATLSRRCLQGMIRDFWGVTKDRLIDEIEAIKDKVESLTWEAIDSVRKVGNIGAHMEKDINLIIEVEPNEADLLISLIETLIKNWYIDKHEREETLKEIVKLGKQKETQKKEKKEALEKSQK